MPGHNVCAVLLGAAPTEDVARKLAESLSACPYVTSFTSTGTLVIGVYALPEHRRWWLREAEESPHVLSLVKAAVLLTDRIAASSPWTRGEVQPGQQAGPCGADCPSCPLYQHRCEGCPSTVHYVASE